MIRLLKQFGEQNYSPKQLQFNLVPFGVWVTDYNMNAKDLDTIIGVASIIIR